MTQDLRPLLTAALAAHQRGDHARAEDSYRLILAADAGHFQACLGLGVLCAQQGRLEAAAELLERAAAIDPASADAQANLAQLRFQQGDATRAGAAAARAIALAPGHAAAHNTQGLVRREARRTDEAVESFRRAASLAPGFVDPHCNLAEMARFDGRFDEAIGHARCAVAIAPHRIEAQLCLGRALTGARRFEPAVEAFEAAIRLAPGSPHGLIGLGTALSRAGRVDAAIARVEAALPALGGSYELLAHLGDLLLTRGDADAALERFRQAAALRPDEAPARLGEAMVLALRGDLPAAFARFERRLESYGTAAFRVQPERRWRGEDIAGRTILLYSEQGLGDTLHFVRYARLVAARGARVVLEVQPALKPLLTGMAGVAAAVGTDEPLPPHDVHCPLMSLPAMLGTTLETIPAEVPYLAAPAPSRAEWAQRLAPLGRPRVGIVWAGHPRHTHDRYRSIPLGTLLPLLDRPDVHFVSLQRELRPGDRGLLAGRPEILDLSARLGSFADTAAVVSELDLVITVDTAVAHLAGALAVPVWTLLAASPEWRWLEARPDSPWYPTMRLFRQRRLGDWPGAVAELDQALTAWRLGR